MNPLSDQLRSVRAEEERRLSDYRALVALLCAGSRDGSKEVGRMVAVLTAAAIVTFCLWLAWKFA